MRDTKVFVADAASTDGTQAAALAFAGRLNIQVIPGGLPSIGRNAGAARAQSQFILFLDADIEIADRTLIRRAVETAQRRNLHCVTTNIRCRFGSIADDVMYAANNTAQRIGSFIKPFGTGMFLLFDRAEFNRIGGFNPRALFAEDYLLTKQISPRRFGILRGRIYTSNRRFQKLGHARMAFFFLRTALNSWNESHFLRDHNYWESVESK